MATFTANTFKNVLKNVDYDNEYDFDTFSESLFDYFDVLTEIDNDEIIEYMSSEIGISSDSEVHGLSKGDVSNLCSFINNLLD